MGDFEAAEDAYAVILEVEPGHAGGELGRIDTALQKGDAAHSLTLIHEALAKRPRNKVLLKKQSEALQRTGQEAKRLDLLRDLQKTFPDDDEISVDLANALRAIGDHASADVLYSTVLQRSQRNIEAWNGRIAIAKAMGDPESVLRRCNAGLEHRPKNPSLLQRKASALQQCGRSREAIALLKDCLASSSDNLAFRATLAECYRALGDLAAADALYAEVLEIQPRHRGALLGRIDTEMARGDFDAALERSEAASSALPSDEGVQARQANLFQRMGRYGDAIRLLVARLERKPASTPLRLQLARAYLAAGDADAADRLFSAILDDKPLHEAALMGRVEVAEARGDITAALALLENRIRREQG